MSMNAEAIQKIADQALAAAGHDLPKVQSIGHVVALPDGMSIHNIEQYLPQRANFRGTLSTHLPAEFAAYVKQHGGTVFIDGEDMRAAAIFDLGTTEQPGHCRHQAKLGLRKTSAYAALLELTSARSHALSQRDLSDWLEDWRDNLRVLSQFGEEMHIMQAVKAVRTVTIESVTKLNSTVHETGSSRSAFEEVEAKSEVGLPHGFEFKCVPYEGLPERTFAVRLNVLTSGSVPSFKPRAVQLETQQEAIAEDFKGMVSTAIGDAASVVVGCFDPR
jgi:uncharacterized protein YfdQ (DUF2303 family)